MTKKQALELVRKLRENIDQNGEYLKSRNVFMGSNKFAWEEFFKPKSPKGLLNASLAVASALESLAYSYNGDIS